MTDFSESTEVARTEFEKKDKWYKRILVLFLIYAALMLTIGTAYSIATNYQVERNQRINSAASAERFQKYVAADAAQNQQIKSYILCIFKVLATPIDTRTPDAAVACDLANNKATGSTGTPTSFTPAPAATTGASPAALPQDTTSTPTTTEPAKQTDPDTRSTLDKLPLLGGLFQALGL